jgi:hypothetical protein
MFKRDILKIWSTEDIGNYPNFLTKSFIWNKFSLEALNTSVVNLAASETRNLPNSELLPNSRTSNMSAVSNSVQKLKMLPFKLKKKDK